MALGQKSLIYTRVYTWSFGRHDRGTRYNDHDCDLSLHWSTHVGESDGRSKRITIELDEVEKTVRFNPCYNKRKKTM